MSEKKEKLLEVKDLKVSFFTPAGEVKAVGGISYDLDYGEVMGVVGESGSGKARRLIPLLVFFSHQVRLLAEALLLKDRTCLPLQRKKCRNIVGIKPP